MILVKKLCKNKNSLSQENKPDKVCPPFPLLSDEKSYAVPDTNSETLKPAGGLACVPIRIKRRETNVIIAQSQSISD
jgi:hypothetical protein